MAAPRQIRGVADLRHMIGHAWEDVCNFIIRPERARYRLADLGPEVFRVSDADDTAYERTDLQLENMRGLRIECSWYRPAAHRDMAPQPCLVYLHGNCGSRWDALEALHLLRHGMSLFTYDACGSGHSEGEHVTLGALERQDLAAVVDYLKQPSSRVTAIGLWGRSMGAVTALMYAARDGGSIQAIVADSPFSSLRSLAADLVAQHGSWVPSLVVEAAVDKVRSSIAKRAHFDLNDLDAVKYARMCTAPAFVFHGARDDFVRPAHSEKVAEHYGGSCLHLVVDGDHNSERGADVQNVAVPFLKLYLIEKPAAGVGAARPRLRAVSAPPIGGAKPEAFAAAAVGSSRLSEQPYRVRSAASIERPENMEDAAADTGNDQRSEATDAVVGCPKAPRECESPLRGRSASLPLAESSKLSLDSLSEAIASGTPVSASPLVGSA